MCRCCHHCGVLAFVGAQPLATSLIPVCDNVEALVASTADADDALAEGARLTADSLFAALLLRFTVAPKSTE